MSIGITDVADKIFDYVIAGGGTAGLALAARLTEDPNTTVAVIEAGHANLNDSNILIPSQFGKTFSNPDYDWSFFTTPQKFRNNQPVFWPRGKGLGGSSAMNFMVWSTPPAQNIDAFERLGNKGWNWENYFKYLNKVETFHKPSSAQLEAYPLTWDSETHGYSGPIHTSFPPQVASLDKPFIETMENMGIPIIHDPYAGDITGAWIASNNQDPSSYTRSYATTGYYQPNKGRANLTVLTDAHVHRVLFDASKTSARGDELTATGFEFLWGERGMDATNSYVVHARKEVILSAGTIMDPQILELSGVGRRDVLERLGLKVNIELPGVGENVQEHYFSGLTYEVDQEHETFDILRDPTVAAENMKLHSSGKGLYRTGVTDFAFISLQQADETGADSIISSVASIVDSQKTAGTLPHGRAEQLEQQLEYLRDPKLPDWELNVFPGSMSQAFQPEEGKRYYYIGTMMNHPFSRGTIHATSTDPKKHPEIDPHYFENDFDLENLVQSFKFVRRIAQTEPFKSTLGSEVQPGSRCQTDEEIRAHIKETFGTTFHTVGTCSMLPREKQGVVDAHLKVYGTKNLRVVDISIVPLHISAHMQATAYVIGEKAADIIRGRT